MGKEFFVSYTFEKDMKNYFPSNPFREPNESYESWFVSSRGLVSIAFFFWLLRR